MPSLLLSNVNRVCNKLDEISIILYDKCPDIVVFTETWLDSSIPDSVVSMPLYSVLRKDRINKIGGGVMMYIRNDIQFRSLASVLDDSQQFEILWCLIRPRILPRKVSNIIVAIVYFPPWYNVALNAELCCYILNCVDKLRRKYPCAGFLITGDFNQADTSRFNRQLHLKQIVKAPTRNHNILDKIFTDCASFYNAPEILPPIARSDHNCVFLDSTGVLTERSGYVTVKRRRYNDSIVRSIGLDLYNTPWHHMYRLDNCQQQADFFSSTVSSIFDKHAPVTASRHRTSDKPWISDYFRELIIQRNSAWHQGNMVLYRKLRNRANRMRLSLKSQFYLDRVETLKKSNPREWWQSIKTLGGWLDNKNDSTCLDGITDGGDTINQDYLPDIFNNFLVSLTDHIPPIDLTALNSIRQDFDAVPESFIITEVSVFKALSRVKLHKSVCDECLTNRMLREFADVLSGPICSLINTSFRTGYVPHQWKVARVTPIPKVMPPTDLKSDLRPISVTSSVAKIAEFFICQFFNEHFDPLVDCNQFGCTRNRSTTLALLKISHLLFTSSDNSCNFIRILLIDFSKAFDLVDSNILLDKFVKCNFPSHISAWFLSFLHNRQQYVKIGNRTSSVVITHAGTPQGTISGPNDFKLLINDLNFDLPYIKYVDDTSLLSVSDDPLDDSLQLAADSLVVWCSVNGMRVNECKTKEMLVYFGKFFTESFVPRLVINGSRIERVETFTLLGVVFSNNLSWSCHVNYILEKVAKRYFIIYQLTRIGLVWKDVVPIYCAVIRSVLEYACVVWHPGLTAAESDEIERVQKRVLRIIFPHLHYKDALIAAHLERLDVRRENMMRTTFSEIKNPAHILHSLLPTRAGSSNTRSQYPYELPRHRTNRYSRSFFAHCIRRRY